MTRAIAALALVLLTSCGTEPEPQGFNFAMQWDHRPEAARWTRAAISESVSSNLVRVTPGDIESWCPAYTSASDLDRAAFWSGTLSALARYESTWNPKASGAGGRYHGLLQISPRTAQSAGCQGDLFTGRDNLACAVKIASRQAGEGRPVARILGDWGPMKSGAKRDEMANWTRAQSYCRKS